MLWPAVGWGEDEVEDGVETSRWSGKFTDEVEIEIEVDVTHLRGGEEQDTKLGQG